jgi:2-phospho-L-lactate guanylyltransferase
VQATAHSFDPATRAGHVVTDDGELLPFDGRVFDESPLRLLRPGQRLTVTVTGTGKDARATSLALGTVGVVPDHPSRP